MVGAQLHSGPNRGSTKGAEPHMANKTKQNQGVGQMSLSSDLTRQREYVSDLVVRKFDFGLVLANAFVRGMRDIGYKSNATAVNELIDNSIQAEASKVHVAFGY